MTCNQRHRVFLNLLYSQHLQVKDQTVRGTLFLGGANFPLNMREINSEPTVTASLATKPVSSHELLLQRSNELLLGVMQQHC